MISEAKRDARTRLIDAYLEAVDAGDFERFRELFASDITFSSSGDTVEGIEAVIDWYETEITTSDYYHDYPKRLHNEDSSIAHGEFGGELPDGEMLQARGLDLFEFDDETEAITKLVVFTDLDPNLAED